MPEIMKSTSAEFLSGGGEMGQRFRSFDWGKTSLSNPDDWEQSLKTCVRIMLSSSQPIWIGWGREEMIKLYNDAYIDIVRGKHPSAFGERVSVVWKDIWKDIKPLLDKAMTKDEGTYVESQLLIMHRSGYPEEVYYTFSYTPVLGDDGKPSGIICYNTADTDRIINERALKTLQQFDILNQQKVEEDVYTNTIEALKTNDKDFPFAFIHKIENEGTTAKLIAYSGIDRLEQVFPSELDLRSEHPLAVALGNVVAERRMVITDSKILPGTISRGDWDITAEQFLTIPVNAAGKELPQALLSVGLNPYRKFDDAFRNFVQLIADQVSSAINNTIAFEEERKRAVALEELDRAKTIFFSNISHEFRTPLTLILGSLEDGLNDSKLPPVERERLMVTHRNSMRLLKLVNTLLDFSRIESGRQKAAYALTDLPSLTRNLAGNFRSLIEKARLQFIVNVEETMRRVYVDSQMWEKIIFNLLSNAFKYTLGGSIIVNLYSENDNAVLEVADTGVGIPEQELPHMFERFHRVENVVGRTYEGTGIGLSLIKELVQLHGGNIQVKSKLARGTTFRITIPFGKKHLPPEQISDTIPELEESNSGAYIIEALSLLEPYQSASAGNSIPATDKPTILIVDDNQDMRQHIQSVLKKSFNTITAANGMEALHKIVAETPALVVSDIMMPIMDGIQLLKEIKQNKNTTHIPVVLLTARAGEESRMEGFETGADDYLVKPFSANELLSRVKTQVQIAKTRRKLERNTEMIQNLYMTAPAFVAAFRGPEHIYDFINPYYQKIVGGRNVVGLKLLEALPELKGQGIDTLFDKVFSTGETVYDNERLVILSSGAGNELEEHYFNYSFQPIYDDENKINGVLAFGNEVTAQVLAKKKIEEINAELEQKVEARTAELQNKNNQLERTNRELEAFNYIASHDLQEPLRKIQTFIFLLQKSNNPESYKKYIDKINESSSRMSELIQSVLDYSRLSHPGEGFEPTDLNNVLATVKNDYELLIGEKKAIIKNDVLPVVKAVPLQMQQLFANLLSNSLKFSNKNPLIEISASFANKQEIESLPNILTGERYVKITFKDNGVGFDNQYREKIFKLFQRLHNKSEYQGTGIGLSIVNKIVENHHGHIFADSKPNEGSKFVFFLPAYK